MPARNAVVTIASGSVATQITDGITTTTLISIISRSPDDILIAPSTNTTPPVHGDDTVPWLILSAVPAGFLNRTAAEIWPGFAGTTQIFAIGSHGQAAKVAVSHPA